MNTRHLSKVEYIYHCNSLMYGIFVNVMIDNCYSMCSDLNFIFHGNHSIKMLFMYPLKTIGLHDNLCSVDYLMHNRMLNNYKQNFICTI